MDITDFAIRNNRLAFVTLAVVCVAGYRAYVTMPQAEDPGFTIRTAIVVTHFPGANPQRVEDLVTDKIEQAVQELPELDSVQSKSTTGVSVVTVNIKEEYIEMRPVWDSLRRKIDKVAPELPSGVRGPFVNDEFGDTLGTVIAITGEGYSYTELREIAHTVRDMLLRLDDTGRIEVHGVQDERVFVEFDAARLAELGVSVRQLQQQLQSQNILISGGNVSTGIERIELEPSGSFESIEDLASTVIRTGEQGLMYLEDIARVSRGYREPPEALMRANGRPAIGLAVATKPTGNIVRHGQEIQEVLSRLRVEYPVGVDLSVVAFQSLFVEQKVDDFVDNVLQAIALVLVAMLIMLGPRTGLVVSSLIPFAMLMSLAVMDQLGIGLNQMSLAALIIALGMLVANAIVMSESIMVELAAGKQAVAAAVSSARELRIPLLTSSLTTSAAFLPIFLAESAVGEYTNQLFKVVTIALLSSWILSLTIVPLLCVVFLKVRRSPASNALDGRLYRAYRKALIPALRFRFGTVAAVVAVFFIALQGFAYIPNIFFPPSDKPIFTIEIEAPAGTAIERTEQIAEGLDRFILAELAAGKERGDGVTTWSSYLGKGGPRFTLSYGPEQSRPEYAFAIVNTTSASLIPALRQQLQDFLAESFPHVRTTIEPLGNGPIVKYPIEVRLMGDETAQLFEIVDMLKGRLREEPAVRGIGDDWGNRIKKIVVDVDSARARRANLSNEDIAVSLTSALSGFAVTDYREGDEVIPVAMRSLGDDRHQIARLETLNVHSQSTGRAVPLQAVADLRVEWQAAKVFRRNRLKAVTVYSNLASGTTAADVMARIAPWLEEQSATWPVGFRYELGGDLEASGEGTQSIMDKVPVAALLIILLLVGQFNSIRKPLIILLTIPLGMIGVIVGLLVTGSYMGFMTFLGVISLAGIVINNAIVLLDRIRIEIDDRGLPPDRAIVEAAQRRLRPILLTTITTSGGLIPLWLGGGVMFEPMAIAILFGLVFSTALTLGVVPALYAILFGVRFKGFTWNERPTPQVQPAGHQGP
ncbi:MAG: efflux RND transporter permease subunit [Bryobacterales bacterium]|nr:efflux RND transporter permease subunit [Bryobacterales bacterium]